ncbi:aldehyde dehydrogenase [Vampirovibrio sp.]|uniref:aldehyde dehydrogenase family protein n=1 Tax=Vampirovibrio sp. TaxID=2717857 RepID=UPI00359385C3
MVSSQAMPILQDFSFDFPRQCLHWIHNAEVPSELLVDKYNPASGLVLTQLARGSRVEANLAIEAAEQAWENWSQTPVISRANLLREATLLMTDRQNEIAQIIALETGRSLKDALGEVGAAIEQGFFMSGEGRRYFGRTTTSAMPNRSAMTLRQPVGVCALIVAANTPIANVTWKAFPALLCGNTVVMKASEDTPYTPVWFARILKEVGLPAGVFNVVQGLGEEAGAPLVEDERVDLVSFTGSVSVGRWIQKTAGERLAKVCLELGGKNAMVVCEDADLENAAQMALLSAFSNAGQRCASGSRIVVLDSVYEAFKTRLLEKTKAFRMGVSESDDAGPVINEAQLNHMLQAVQQAKAEGATVLIGGERMRDEAHGGGYYMAPTILENVSPDAAISMEELFGPITTLYRVSSFAEAVALNNRSNMGLTAAIHTANMHRVQRFIELSRTGVVSVNGPTYGSEPHMPFGGLKNSGNGWREPGPEALDVYSEVKTVYIKYDPALV